MIHLQLDHIKKKNVISPRDHEDALKIFTT